MNRAAARMVLALIALRWLAGIAEGAGFPHLSEAAAMILLAGLGLIFLTRMGLARDGIVLFLGLMAWVLVGTVSMLSGTMANPEKAFALLTVLTLYALIANATLLYLHTEPARALLRPFLTLFIIVGAALSFAQVGSGHGFVEQGKSLIQRAYGSDVHPVSFALQLVAALVALECLRAKDGRPLSARHLAVLALGLAALYLTFARTAWVMAALIVGLTLFRQSRWPARLALVILGAPLLVLGVALSDRFADLQSLPFFLSNFSLDNIVFDYRYIDNSISWRIVNWGYGLQQALDGPFLGYGPGQSAAASYFNLEMHNILLETFFEGGILGLAALLVVLAGLARLHLQLPRTTAADRYAATLTNSFGLSLLLAVILSTSFVDQLMSFILYMLLLSAAATPGVAAQRSVVFFGNEVRDPARRSDIPPGRLPALHPGDPVTTPAASGT